MEFRYRLNTQHPSFSETVDLVTLTIRVQEMRQLTNAEK